MGRAWSLLELGRAPEAEAVARDVLADSPEDPSALMVLGRALQAQGRTEEALAAARAVLAAVPDHPEPLMLAADCLAELGKARGGIGKGERIPPEHPGAQAVQLARQAVALAPDEWGPAYCLARAAGYAGVEQESLQAAHRAVELGPHEPSTHVLLGMVQEMVRDLRGARASYERALAVEPGHADALRRLALLDADGGGTGRQILPNPGRAARSAAAAAAADPTNPQTRRVLASVLGGMLSLLMMALLLETLWMAGRLQDGASLVSRAVTVAVFAALLAFVVVRWKRALPGRARWWVPELLPRRRARVVGVGVVGLLGCSTVAQVLVLRGGPVPAVVLLGVLGMLLGVTAMVVIGVTYPRR